MVEIANAAKGNGTIDEVDFKLLKVTVWKNGEKAKSKG